MSENSGKGVDLYPMERKATDEGKVTVSPVGRAKALGSNGEGERVVRSKVVDASCPWVGSE